MTSWLHGDQNVDLVEDRERAGLFHSCLPVHWSHLPQENDGKDLWSLVTKVKIGGMIIDRVLADLNVALW